MIITKEQTNKRNIMRGVLVLDVFKDKNMLLLYSNVNEIVIDSIEYQHSKFNLLIGTETTTKIRKTGKQNYITITNLF